MVAAIKEICIFVIIAQAVMFFVPGNSYMKYVRVLVGILMILKITEPIFGLVLDEEREKEIRERVLLLEQNIDSGSDEFEVEDNSMGIYESIEEELKNRLNECGSGYDVLEVSITKEQKLSVTLSGKKEKEKVENKIQIEPVVIGNGALESSSMEEGKEETELKRQLGNCIGVDPERIEIVYD